MQFGVEGRPERGLLKEAYVVALEWGRDTLQRFDRLSDLWPHGRSRRRCGSEIINRPAAPVTDGEAHAIARHAAPVKPDQHIAGVAKLWIEPQRDGVDPIEVGQSAQRFDGQVITTPRRSLRIHTESVRAFAGHQVQIRHEQRDAHHLAGGREYERRRSLLRLLTLRRLKCVRRE